MMPLAVMRFVDGNGHGRAADFLADEQVGLDDMMCDIDVFVSSIVFDTACLPSFQSWLTLPEMVKIVAVCVLRRGLREGRGWLP